VIARLIIVADDLTGAADAAAPFARTGRRVTISPWQGPDGYRRLLRAGAAPGTAPEVLVIETDSRGLSPARAAARLVGVATDLRRSAGGRWLVKKLDSQLRGPIGAELTAFRRALGGPATIVAPAFPAMGRTTVDGIQDLGADPIGSGDPDRTQDPRRAPATRSLREVCELPDAVVVTAGGCLPVGVDVVVDAVTDLDLDALAEQLVDHAPRPLVVATGGLTRALARLASCARESTLPPPPAAHVAAWAAPDAAVLVVSFSPSPIARAQVATLATGPRTEVVTIDLPALLRAGGTTTAELGRAVNHAIELGGTTILTVSGDPPADVPDEVVRTALMTACTDALRTVDHPTPVIANGGDAARCIVEAWEVGHLDVLRELRGGASVAVTDQGSTVITKSGGFGDRDTLMSLLDDLRGPPAVRPHQPAREDTA
jgi:D-threonate/D-erythronate kinase